MSELKLINTNFFYLFSIRPFDDLIYEDRFNNDDDANEYDSEDSNQENHFGNDYPDEDDQVAMNSDQSEDEDFESAGARELRQAVEKFVLCDDDEDSSSAEYFSSDDEDCLEYSDPYVHTVDVGFENEFIDDADRYGMAYARYKARVLKRLHDTPEKNTEGESDDDGGESSDKDAEK